MAQVNPGIMPATQNDPLAQLRDIHLPPAIETSPLAIEAWPPAPGWWILAFLAALTILLSFYWLWNRWQRNKYRREAIKELDGLLQSYAAHGDTAEYLQDYQRLLKRVALTRYNRQDVANLTGESWVAFLDKSSDSNEFTMGDGQILIDGNYQAAPEANIDKLHSLGQHWIRKHRPLAELEQAA